MGLRKMLTGFNMKLMFPSKYPNVLLPLVLWLIENYTLRVLKAKISEDSPPYVPGLFPLWRFYTGRQHIKRRCLAKNI